MLGGYELFVACLLLFIVVPMTLLEWLNEGRTARAVVATPIWLVGVWAYWRWGFKRTPFKFIGLILGLIGAVTALVYGVLWLLGRLD